jgi:hypothetical protein
MLNYNDFREFIRESLDEFGRMRDFEFLLPSLRINQYIMNILSSSVIFLSHTKYNINKRYGKNSDMSKMYIGATRFGYDTNFAYRFLYRLRNYTQHCGIPAIRVSFRTGEKVGEPDQIGYFIDINLDKNSLLVEREYWSQVQRK